jgi:sulfite exporter TauE/SafE
MTGFLLGLANGTSCLAFCAPVLVPYLLAEGDGARRAASLLGRFMVGRAIGYVAFGVVAGLVGALVGAAGSHGLLFGSVYVALAALLLFYGLASGARRGVECAAGGRASRVRRWASRWPRLLPVLLGLLTGLNLCPPFALALAAAAERGSIAGSVWFFVTFFLGTSVFFLPLPGLGGLRRFESLRTIARLAAGLVGAFYLYRGAVLLYGGLAGL